MTIATKNGAPIITSGSLARNCACCKPAGPCVGCCSPFPQELQATVSISSIAEACYRGSGYLLVGGGNNLRDVWIRKAPWNQHGLASGSFTLSPTVLWFAGTEEEITSATKCKSYTYGSGLVVADDETVVEFRIIATCWAYCVWKVSVAFTQYIFPLFTPPAVVGGPLNPGFRVESLFNYSPESLTNLVADGTRGAHRASASVLVTVGSPCAGNSTNASLSGTVSAVECTPESGSFDTTRCVRPVDGGVVVVSPGFPPPVSEVYSISDFSGAGELTGEPCAAQTASFSVTLSAS